MLNLFLSTFDSLVGTYLRTTLFHPAALVIAVLAVLSRYVRPFLRHFCKGCSDPCLGRCLGNGQTRTFAMGVIFLQLFYAPYLRGAIGESPLAISLGILLTESLVQVGADLWEHFTSNDADREEDLLLCDLDVDSRYQDITIKFRHITLYFWVQVVLMGYFLFYINNDAAMHSGELKSIVKWLVALNLTQVASNDEAGERFHAEFWFCLLSVPVPESQKKEMDRFCEVIPVPFKVHWCLRCAFDFAINGVCRSIIMGIAPIYLAETGAMDFIKDSLALFFVTKLDDYDDIHSLGSRLLKHLERKSNAADVDKLGWLLKAIVDSKQERTAKRSLGIDGYASLGSDGDSRDDLRRRSDPGEAEMS